jgi:hypothetical protein
VNLSRPGLLMQSIWSASKLVGLLVLTSAAEWQSKHTLLERRTCCDSSSQCLLFSNNSCPAMNRHLAR